MEKRNEIIIRHTIYGLLIGIFFPVASLVLHSLTGQTPFTLQGFSRLHVLFPGQYLLDLIPVLTFIAGFLSGVSKVRNLDRFHNQITGDRTRSEKVLSFTEQLINNELNAELEPEESKDALGKALINLRNNLKQNIAEQQTRKMEDDQRNWVSEGLAKFGDIMRGSFNNMEEFSYNIISNLVKYLNANQGGFFLLEQDSGENMYFDLKACYAYDRKKFANKRIEWGEGLIGTCALEKQSIHMTDVPDGYVEITSGLGLANPGNLLIVPLLAQDEVLGIIELASFNEMKQFEINFVESVAESTAITISSLRSNIRTSELLKESREQAETLARQEEKMRLNMEELKETQEQAARQAETFISFTNSVNHTLIRAEYQTDGTLIYANTKFLKRLGYFSNSEVEGQHILKFIDEKDRKWFNPIWDRLAGGGKHYQGYMKHISKTGQDIWTMATYTCVRQDDGTVEKILFLAIDATEQKKQSLDYEGQIEAINRLNMKAEFAPDGKFINCNELFLETMKFTRNELAGMSVFDFIEKKEMESFNETWTGIIKGIPYQGKLKSHTKYEDEKWLSVSFTAVNDMYEEVAKVIYLATDITNERLMELESRKQTDQLKIQEDKLKLAGVELKKKLEQNRSEMEQQYQTVTRERDWLEKTLANSADLIFSIDQRSRIVYMNRTAEKFWNIKAGKLAGHDVKTLFPGKAEEYDSFIVSLFNRDAVKITGERKKVRIRDKDGKWKQVEMLLSYSDLTDDVSYTVFISV